MLKINKADEVKKLEMGPVCNALYLEFKARCFATIPAIMCIGPVCLYRPCLCKKKL